MHFLYFAALLGAVGASPVTTTVNNNGAFCTSIRSQLTSASEAKIASSYCSSLFSVGPKTTSTVTTTVTDSTTTITKTSATGTSTKVSKVTTTGPAKHVTQTTTVHITGTSTPACAPVSASLVVGAKLERVESVAEPSVWSTLIQPQGVTRACQCLALATVTRTTATVHATSTVTAVRSGEGLVTRVSTTTYTPTVTSTVTETSSVAPACTPLIDDGDFTSVPKTDYDESSVTTGSWTLGSGTSVVDASALPVLSSTPIGDLAFACLTVNANGQTTLSQNLTGLTAGTKYQGSFTYLLYPYLSLSVVTPSAAKLTYSYAGEVIDTISYTAAATAWATETFFFTPAVDGEAFEILLSAGAVVDAGVYLTDFYIW